jgi:phosphopantothenoylcysteine decarboxylase/phosphopantothenate--cysteine ligase
MFDAVLPLARSTTSSWPPPPWPTGARQAGEHKIKKDGSGQVPDAGLTENPDILATVARLPRRSAPGAWALPPRATTWCARARQALRKGVPLIVGNLGPATFGRDDNALVLVDADGERELPHRPTS